MLRFQKFLIGKDKNLKENLINNLINNCLILIIDQYGNYVIQNILLFNENKSSSAIAMKIFDNVAYYSKQKDIVQMLLKNVLIFVEKMKEKN